jgi:hypothetical protein
VRLFSLLFLLLIGAIAYEGYKAHGYYRDIEAGTDILREIEPQISYSLLSTNTSEVIGMRLALERASERFASARRGLDGDLALKLGAQIPDVDRQVTALRALVSIADESTRVGHDASEILLAYVQRREEAGEFTAREGIAFVAGQQAQIFKVRAGIENVRRLRTEIEGPLIGPLEEATRQVDETIDRFEALISDYERLAVAPGR